MATADKLRFYFPSKYLSADGGTITQQTADSGGTTKTIVDSALTESNDYWNGAVGWFDGATTTTALQGVFFHIMDFDAVTDTLTLAKDLPATPVAGDLYYLVLGGKYRGATECFGLEAAGNLPELISTTGTNITGLTIKKCSPSLETGTLSLFFDYSLLLLFAKMGSESYGVGLDVSSNVTDGIVFCADGEKYVQIDTVAASLPGSDQTDTFTLTEPLWTFTPDYEGSETSSAKIRYRLEIIKNTDSVDSLANLKVWSEKLSGSDTTVATGESLGIGEDDFAATDASDWPTHSFWIKNTTVNAGSGDCRYVFYRSGNQIYCAASSGLRGFSAVSWSAADNLEIMSDVDLGLDAPSGTIFENPSTETTAPSGVTFGDYPNSSNALSIGTLATTGIYGIWRRETIVANHRAKTGVDTSTSYNWD